MFDKLSIDTSYEPFYRDLTKHKSIKALAKIDGINWYDISKFVKKVTINNQIQLLDTPTIDTAKLTVKNDNNAFTSTVYNDEFNPSAGKINGTLEQGYLNKIWEVQVYTVIYDVDNRDCLDLPDGAIAYFRYSLVDVVNGITPVGYELTPDTLLDVAIPLFRGWKPSQAIVEKHKEAEIELKDILWITTQKRLKNPLLYTSMTPSAIIADLLNRCGLDSSYQDLQQLSTTFDVFIAEQDKSYWQVIQQICEATAGVISTGPDGKIIYRTRIENFTDPEIALTINQDTFSKYNLEQKAKYNQLKVESEGYEISASNEDLLVDTTLTGDAAIIKAGQTQNFEFEYTSEYAKDFADTVFITVKLGDTIVDNLGAFSQGDDDGFIRLNKLTAYPDKLILNITNLADTVDYTIAQVRFRGRQIKKLSLNKVEELNVTDEPDNEISIKSYYSDTSILSNVLDALKFNINKDIVFSLTLNEFYPDIFAGNLVNFNIPLKGIASGTFIIEQIKHIINDDLSYNTELVISEWKDIVFDINNKEIYKSTPVEVITESASQSQIEEIIGSISELQEDMQEQQDITSYLDGVAPNTPTGLLVTTEVINRESVLKVSFNPNTELDLLGYEIAYSQDGIWWQYNVVSETSVYIQVIGNTQYFVKVRAFDAEGYKSQWTDTVSIVSAKDTIPPEAPTGLTVEPLFQKIIVKWTPNTEPDLAKYKVEVSIDNFDTVKDTIYTDSNYIVYGGTTNTTYYFRVLAIDTSENESEYSLIVSTTTVSVYDKDLESEILDGLASDLETLNSETLPALQDELQGLQDLTGYLDGEAPSTPTGLTLTTELLNDESVIKVMFNANTETDIIGYEVAYSTDQTRWSYVNTTETSLYISVIANTTYYVKVRAFDAEGYKSSWTSTQSIVSAKDITSPSTPSGLVVVEALFQKIVLKWNPNTEKDFEKYKVQVSKDNFTTVEETLYTSSNYLVYGGDTDTKYYFRVSAIDTSGNESNFSSIVNATTAKVYDEDLESEILNGLADNLDELNTTILPGLQDDLQNLEELTSFLDGTVPSVPTGLTLTTELLNDESAIKVSYNSNTETDLLGYEIAYSTNQTKWSYATTTDTTVYISVIPNTQYYVKIRAFDAEGFKSNWTSTQNIISAKDTLAPSTPTGLSAEPLFQKIVLKWNPNNEKDFEKYKVQVSKNNFSSVLDTFYTTSNYLVYSGQTNTTYYFRISAIDTSDNESGFSTVVNAITKAVYDEDLESEILEGLVNDLNKLNTVTLPNLQDELDSKLDDLPGEITETHIADNSISTSKIKANAITANEINAGAVTSDKIAANAIKANHIGANEIITNIANIATGIIDTAHIKDAAIQTAKIKDGAITNAKIANLAVDDAKIANLNASKITSGYIDANRIAANSITSDKIAANAINAGHIGTNQIITNSANIANAIIDTAHIKDAAITNAKIANLDASKINTGYLSADRIASNAITSSKIAANAITSNHIGANQIITNSANIANGIIDTAHIKDAAIQTAKIKDGAITNAKIRDAAIDDAKIANIDAAKITSGYIDADRIDANSITVSKLVAKPAFSLPEGAIAYFTDSLVDNVSGITPEGYDEINLSPKITLMPENAPEGSIIAPLMVADKIYADHIASNAITSEKIAASAVTTDKLNANAVTADKIAANAITADKILANAVTSDKIAANAITANKIGTNQIITNSANIATGVIETAHIKDAAISTAKIKDAAITNAKIANLAVDDAKIANLNAAKINAGYISADRIASNTITSAKIAAGAITAEKVASNAITADKIAANSITSAKIAAGAVTADKITSNFTISAGQYIQAGTADRNYKLDGTQGLIRTIGSNIYNIFSYVTDGFVTFDGTTMSTFISLADFDLTDYTVILVQSSAYNDSYEANKYVMCDWEKGTSGFTIYFYSFVPSETLTSSAASVNLTKDRTGEWSGWYNLGTTSANCIYLTVATFFHKTNGTTTSTGSSHQYRFAHSYNIKLRAKAVYINENNVTWTSEIDWGDGTFSQHSLVFSRYEFDTLIDNVYAKQEIYREMKNRIGRLGIIGYSVLGY